VSVRLYHLAHELNLQSSQLLATLQEKGMSVQSVMGVLDAETADTARRVISGELVLKKRALGDVDVISLPPPVVPAPANPIRPVQPAARGTGKSRRPDTTRPGPTPRRGIRIFRQKETRERRHADQQKAEEIFAGRTIPIIVPIALKEFSQQIGVKTNTLLLHLMKQGVRVNPNTTLDDEMVLILAEAFNRTVEIQQSKTAEDELEELLQSDESAAENTTVRPPVVAVLGHVDHGKTSLLDNIRKARVAAGEAGGITQHIGAYSVQFDKDHTVTFIDTPGHEAFTEMRARGAKITDIVILIVAADDGVMPQTEEALNHARAAEVPIIVAINKCDRPDANPDQTRTQLAGLDLAAEEWGGNTAMIEVSAKTGKGIEDLLERITLEAEVLELRANPTRAADGYVVEANKQPGKGVVATLLVKNGTLKRGDTLLAGSSQGKVKSLMNERGQQLKEAGPSMPVEVTGLDEVPEAGWRFQVVDNADIAKKVADDRSVRRRERDLAAKAHGSFELLMDRMGGNVREQRLLLKADVKGSVEAIRGKLTQLDKGTEDVDVKLLHSGVGGITESDVLLAEASDGIILGFNVVPDAKARVAADKRGVVILTFQVIYELLDEVMRMMEGLMPTDTEETVTGHAEIRQIFIYKKTRIGGCFVTDGVVKRNSRVRLVRDGIVIMNAGEFDSLKRFKDDAKEVREGFECGLRIKNYEDIKEGDVIEAYELEEKKRTL